MECTIPGFSLKTFHKALVCLGKISEEVYLDVKPDKLVLSTYNSSRSAFGAISLPARLFEKYVYLNQTASRFQSSSDASSSSSIQCRVMNKALAMVFNMKHTSEKGNVEKADMRLLHDIHSGAIRLSFTLFCKNGVEKVFKLLFESCDVLYAPYTYDVCTHHITCSPEMLSQCLNNFDTRLEEISISADPKHCTFSSFHSGTESNGANLSSSSLPSRLQTQVTLTSDEFEKFVVASPANITFCLKELRAVLTLAESMNQPISMHFLEAGSPCLFQVTIQDYIQADFVLATLLPSKEISASTENVPMLNEENSQRRAIGHPSRAATTDDYHNDNGEHLSFSDDRGEEGEDDEISMHGEDNHSLSKNDSHLFLSSTPPAKNARRLF